MLVLKLSETGTNRSLNLLPEVGGLDQEKEIIDLRGEVAVLKADLINLQGWQKSQNGTIHRVDSKVDKLQYWIMGTMATSLITLVALFIKG